ncbi:hypothetical protein AB0D10_32030 [Kitasatospora sp. NPDC048545]|uniref:hypothetical protein n=1 Tax=Kitasatospora sp. NPDC048545 TaxID=3157208 RepID=UPI0033CAFB30
MVTAFARDPDVESPPNISVAPEQTVPFSLMRRFVARVAEPVDALGRDQDPRLG